MAPSCKDAVRGSAQLRSTRYAVAPNGKDAVRGSALNAQMTAVLRNALMDGLKGKIKKYRIAVCGSANLK